VRDTGVVFLFPTYLFVGCLTVAIGLGIWKTIAAARHPMPVIAPKPLKAATQTAGLWLLFGEMRVELAEHVLLRTFSSGCMAMTGEETVSNGVMACKDPRDKNARITLVTIIAILIVLLAGIASCAAPTRLARPMPPGAATRVRSRNSWEPWPGEDGSTVARLPRPCWL